MSSGFSSGHTSAAISSAVKSRLLFSTVTTGVWATHSSSTKVYVVVEVSRVVATSVASHSYSPSTHSPTTTMSSGFSSGHTSAAISSAVKSRLLFSTDNRGLSNPLVVHQGVRGG